MTIGSDHHGDFNALHTKSGDAPSPFTFDHGSPFELEPKFVEELDSGIDIFHHDPDVIHSLDCHVVSLAFNDKGSAAPGARRIPRREIMDNSASPGRERSRKRRAAHYLWS